MTLVSEEHVTVLADIVGQGLYETVTPELWTKVTVAFWEIWDDTVKKMKEEQKQ